MPYCRILITPEISLNMLNVYAGFPLTLGPWKTLGFSYWFYKGLKTLEKQCLIRIFVFKFFFFQIFVFPFLQIINEHWIFIMTLWKSPLKALNLASSQLWKTLFIKLEIVFVLKNTYLGIHWTNFETSSCWVGNFRDLFRTNTAVTLLWQYSCMVVSHFFNIGIVRVNSVNKVYYKI